ncbi:trypsin-like serine peptidase [Micromonospora sp. CA-248260]|uniref:trypsin-like serine peptidase n=1 Tax=Micromonospora sp. CA-248260 TaxID=3239962 RepID=UPI003D912E62
MTSKPTSGRRSRIAGAVVALVTATLAGTAQQPAAAAPGPVAIHGVAVTAAERQAVLAYWTPQRIADLKTPSAQVRPVAKPDGAPWTGADAVSRTVGRLFFTDHGEDTSCTATVLDSANRSTVVTAAHCVNNTDLIGEDNQWSANVLFIPGYRDGRAPYGRFVGRLSVAPSTWLLNDQIESLYDSYDQAFVVLHPNSDGRRVQDAVGAAQRIGYDVPGARVVHQFGYPRASSDETRQGLPEYTGERLAYCAGRAVEQQATEEWPEPPGQWGTECVMGGGSSGGPRFATLDRRTGLGIVVGDNSHGYLPEKRYLVGPQFSTAITRPLFERAQHS